ncbi:MAG TPA: hypothetical protein VMB51_12135 [Solirubrobacteraceae bacterium]|nr:hypothetical protein [Solirubrobacteraceae bacterium]
MRPLVLLALLACLLLPGVARAKESPVEKPVNTKPPSISGKAREESTLTAKEGKWTGGGEMSFAFQWQRCKEGCHSIPGATADEYTASFEDVGYTLKVIVAATNSAGKTAAESAITGEVAPFPPKSASAPVISGELEDGRVLSVSDGEWSGSRPLGYAYQWELCTSTSSKSCTPIKEETGEGENGPEQAQYRVVPSDEGKLLRATVTVETHAGTASATSAQTSQLAAGSPVNVLAPTVSAEAFREGRTLTAHPGTWAGTPPLQEFTYQWLACNAMTGCMATGVTGSTFTPSSGEVGDTIELTVSTENPLGPGSATSAATPVIEGSPPRNTERPSLTGVAEEGRTLQASTGRWEGSGPFAYEYQWQLCAESGCQSVPDATASSYTLGEEAVGATVRVLVTARGRVEPPASEASIASAVVRGVAPVNTGPPAITGTPEAGQTLQASTGAWESKEPLTYTYTWKSCLAPGECTEQSAPASTYALTSADVGNTVSVTVSATNKGGSAISAPSPATQTVIAPAGAAAAGWGPDKFGQIGTPYSTVAEATPVDAAEGLTNITELAGSLALLNNGTVAAWGTGYRGELGDNGNEAAWEQGHPWVMVKARENASHEPQGLLEGVKQVAGGGTHRLALLKDGRVMAWGQNQDGELGQINANGEGVHGFEYQTGLNERLPKVVQTVNAEGEVTPLQGVTAIAAGGGADFALTNQGTVMAWGTDNVGQLGIAKSEECKTEVSEKEGRSEPCSAIPRPVVWEDGEPLEGVQAVYAGEFAAYARLEGGRLVSWGDNSDGELGTAEEQTGGHAKDAPPAYVLQADGQKLENVAEVAAGYNIAFARLTNNEIYAWGSAALEGLPGLEGEDCAKRLTKSQEEDREGEIQKYKEAKAKVESEEKRLAGEDKEYEFTSEGQKQTTAEYQHLEEELKNITKELHKLVKAYCVTAATKDETLDQLLNTSEAHVQALSAGDSDGEALSGGRVFTWGADGLGQLGNGEVLSDTGYRPAEVPDIPPAKALGGVGRVLLRSGESPPEPLIAANATTLGQEGHWGIDLSWQATHGTEALEAEHLNYKPYQPSGVYGEEQEPPPPNESEAAEGPPRPVSEEQVTIVFSEEPSEQASEPATRPPEVGEKLKAEAGEWEGAEPLYYDYQWQRCQGELQAKEGMQATCGASSPSWEAVGSRRTSAALKLTREEKETFLGYHLRVLVTVENEQGSGEATSAPTPAVEPEEEAERDSTHVSLLKVAEEQKKELVFSYDIEGMQLGRDAELVPLESRPYEIGLYMDGHKTKTKLAGEGRERRLVLAPPP